MGELMEQYTPMIRQYLEIKADYQDAFLFFRLGDFYELFFDDAVKASRELEITLTGRDGGASERIPMCGVPYHAAEQYIKLLVQKGYKVAICEQVEDPKEAKGVVKREVIRVITPGTVMEGSMLSPDNNYLACVIKVNALYGVAFCDLTTGEFYVPDQGLDSFQKVMEEVISYSPKEILFSTNIAKSDISQVERHVQTSVTCIEATEQKLFTWSSDIKPWIPKHAENLAQSSVLAAGALMSYLMETQKRNMGHIRELKIYQPNRALILDPFTRKNLELTETVRNKSKYGSLWWLLDRTVTPMGGRMLKRWLDKPLVNPERIAERLDGVEFFLKNALLRADIRSLLKEVYDLERLVAKVSYGNVNGRDMVQIRRSLTMIPKIIESFASLADSKLLPGLIRFIKQMDPCMDIRMLLEKAIVDEPPVSIKDGGIIKEGYDQKLDQLRKASQEGKQWIANLEQMERNITGIRSLKVGYNKVFGYYIEVTKANLHLLPEGRYERKQTLANAERFVTAELKEKEALIFEAEEKLIDLEYQLFLEVREQVQAAIPRLQELAGQFATLDALSALAELAQTNRYVRPSISKGEMMIKGGRHPVIEAVLQKGRFIPNDTHMDHKNRVYLITGPNMAGKSTYMRQIALMILMFQMGSFVPADEAHLPIVDRIFTRIGAADDLVEGQSTFMVEMNEIQITATQATENSLVIIDELGRGTSTQDGIAIAQAVIEHLHNRIGCKTLVSTHFHELAYLEETLPHLRNYHMAVRETGNDVIFTRTLAEGAASKSYGIYCAELAGIPDEIIRRAKQIFEELQARHTTQLELFHLEEASSLKSTPQIEVDQNTLQAIERIKQMDLMNTTPLEALQFLFEIKNQLMNGITTRR